MAVDEAYAAKAEEVHDASAADERVDGGGRVQVREDRGREDEAHGGVQDRDDPVEERRGGSGGEGGDEAMTKRLRWS